MAKEVVYTMTTSAISDLVHMSIMFALSVLLLICLVQSLRMRKGKRGVRIEVLSYSLCFSLTSCVTWGLNRSVDLYSRSLAILIPYILSIYFYQIFTLIVLVCVLFCWLNIISIKYPSTHISVRIAKKRNLAFAFTVVWVTICFIGARILYDRFLSS
eukprot:TRINITY_DN4315_c0_g2_i3.p1 TRINITY_DN4315_c0_g2~~TRINITY_DN4315_c0_g2_i3.p1  ORF type:complete len:157 (+),score=21.77 TRINITY_DN4315_c0_g2_i3:70-540(+)